MLKLSAHPPQARQKRRSQNYDSTDIDAPWHGMITKRLSLSKRYINCIMEKMNSFMMGQGSHRTPEHAHYSPRSGRVQVSLSLSLSHTHTHTHIDTRACAHYSPRHTHASDRQTPPTLLHTHTYTHHSRMEGAVPHTQTHTPAWTHTYKHTY